jgi:hypothetical protein
VSATVYIEPTAITQKFSGHGQLQHLGGVHHPRSSGFQMFKQIFPAWLLLEAMRWAVVYRRILAFSAEDSLPHPYCPSICLN